VTTEFQKYSTHPYMANSLLPDSPEQTNWAMPQLVRTEFGNTTTRVYAGRIANVSGFTLTAPVIFDEQQLGMAANQHFQVARCVYPNLVPGSEISFKTMFCAPDEILGFRFGSPTWLEDYREETGSGYLAWVEGALSGPRTGTSARSMINQEAARKFEQAFKSARYVDFEDGMENEFSRELSLLVRKYGAASQQSIARLLADNSISRMVVSEALRVLGQMEDSSSHQARLWLLEQGLSSPSPLVRDGAVVGLALLDDPNAVTYLREAVKTETVESLRRDMTKVLEQLA
jgi:HEAT repeats